MLTAALDIAREVAITLGVPVALALAWKLLALVQAYGYRTTYAAGVLKAVGAGQIAAQAHGLTLFDPAGRAIAVEAGAAYLMQKVPDAASALGITTPDEHAQRVDTQIGLLTASAAATAAATATAASLIDVVQPDPLARAVASLQPLITKPPAP
jgi:hypothetical protein